MQPLNTLNLHNWILRNRRRSCIRKLLKKIAWLITTIQFSWPTIQVWLTKSTKSAQQPKRGVHHPPETPGFPNPILSEGIWWYAVSATTHTSPYETNPTAVAPCSTQSADSPSHLICSFARVNHRMCAPRLVSVPWTLPQVQTTRSPAILACPRMAGPGSDSQ